MPAAATETHSRIGSALSAAHQICVTHCLHGEGIDRQAGFNIRASSTDDPLLIRFAKSYPHYELPAGMNQAPVYQEATPRRLALVRIPGGKSALIHSVYLPDETRGRANNFLSHIIVRPVIKAREALAAWAAPDWATSHDSISERNLPQLADLPVGNSITDRTLSEFLQLADLASDRELATVTCPQRLVDSQQQRRELVRLAIRGCQLALQAGSQSGRSRFYILAEPGLTAMLLYAAARLLPQALAANLTFSTYEHSRRDLRHFKHAQVVGTYLAEPEKALGDDFFSTRGFALDTFSRRYSPELGEVVAELEEWIDLAAQGEWETIDRVQDQLGEKAAVFVSFSEAMQVATFSSRLEMGTATPDDLLTLNGAPWGAAVLEKHWDKVWSLVRDASLTDPRIREQFTGLLREHLTDLEQDAAQALRSQPPANWQLLLRLIASLVNEEPRRLRHMLRRILPDPPYVPDMRIALLRELHDLGVSPLDLRRRFHVLLNNCTNRELEQLANAEGCKEWFVWALNYALLKGESRADAVRYVHDGDDKLLQTFWRHFQLLKEEGHRRAILAPLFAPAPKSQLDKSAVEEPGLARFLSRSLKNHMGLRAVTLTWLLDFVGAWKKEWLPFWCRDNHLSLLIDLLRKSDDDATPIWDRLCSQIDRQVLIPGDCHAKSFLMELAAARDRPGPALPPKAAQAISHWMLLRDHFEKASVVPQADCREVINACNRLQLDPLDVLTGYFTKFVRPQAMSKEVVDDFIGFVHGFHTGGKEYQDYSTRLVWWLRIVDSCADETEKASFQRYYLESQVPFEFRWRLSDEAYSAGKLVRQVHEEMQKPTEPASEAVAGREDVLGLDSDRCQLTGVRVGEVVGATPLQASWKRFRWLLPSLAAGIVAAILLGLFKIQLQRIAVLLLFVPAVYALAASVALQSVALAVRRVRTVPDLRRELGRESLTGLLLGTACGLVVGAATTAYGGTLWQAVCLGIAIAGGMTGAALLGLATPHLLRQLRWQSRVAGGSLAQALAGVGALVLYFSLARLVLG
jgi:hypothetical protein